jgi:hypothetical protein
MSSGPAKYRQQTVKTVGSVCSIEASVMKNGPLAGISGYL